MSEGDRSVAGVAEPEPLRVPAGVPEGAHDDQRAWVESLEEELRKHRPAALTALLSATALLRVASVGTAVAVQLDVSAFSGDRPSGVAIGLVGASQAITEMLFAPFMARLADRYGRSRFLVGGPVIGAIGVLLVALATSAAHVAGSRLIEGVGAAAFVPVALGTIAAVTSGSQPIRARASGAFEGSTLAGYAGGFALGTFLWPAMHRGAFLVMAAIYLSAAVICGGWVRHLHPMHVSPIRTVLRAVFGPGPMRSFMPAWVSCFALLGAFVAHLPALLRHEPVAGQTLMHHFDARFIGLVLVTWVVLFLIGIVLWTPFLSRGRPLSIMRRAVPGAWLIVAALLVINHLPLVWAPLVLPFLAAGVLWLAGFGPAAVAYLADCTEQLMSDRAALMSFYTVALAGGGAIGAVLGGVAVRWLHADGLFLLGLLLSTLAFSLLTRVARQDGAGRASATVAMAG